MDLELSLPEISCCTSILFSFKCVKHGPCLYDNTVLRVKLKVSHVIIVNFVPLGCTCHKPEETEVQQVLNLTGEVLCH